MNISEIILFISSTSNACVQCMRVITPLRLNIPVVRLDTEEARTTVENGKYFQIKSVPSMVVTYEDGNIQLFVGSPKIIQWLTAYNKANLEKNRRPEVQKDRRPVEKNMYGFTSDQRMYSPKEGYYRPAIDNDRYHPVADEDRYRSDDPQIIDEDSYDEQDQGVKFRPVAKPPPYKRPKPASHKVIDQRSYEDHGSPEDYEEDPAQSEVYEAPPKKIKKKIVEPPIDEVMEDAHQEYLELEEEVPIVKKKAKAKAKTKKNRKTAEIEDENDPTNIGKKIAKEKLMAVAKAKTKPIKSPMNDIFAKAKQMEMNRDNSLGYKEEDLPHY